MLGRRLIPLYIWDTDLLAARHVEAAAASNLVIETYTVPKANLVPPSPHDIPPQADVNVMGIYADII